jgi:hypothetical protein
LNRKTRQFPARTPPLRGEIPVTPRYSEGSGLFADGRPDPSEYLGVTATCLEVAAADLFSAAAFRLQLPLLRGVKLFQFDPPALLFLHQLQPGFQLLHPASQHR